MLNRNEEAVAAADRALACDPDFAAAFTTRGNALRSLGRIDEALAAYDRAVALTPNHAVVRFNRAVCLLVNGDFERGWPEYEWRWHMPSHHEKPRTFDQPLWLGEQSLMGKRIVLHREQGLGDTIQFCRYAPLVSTKGATVIMGVAPSLHGLLTSLAGVSLIVSNASEMVPDFDYQTPLLSLPLAFRTQLETIPASIPYLQPPEMHRRKWRDRLGERRGIRVGLAWSGNPNHSGDRVRTIRLEQAVSMVPEDLTIHCLQRDLRSDDVPGLAMNPRVVFHGPDLADFCDTAALIAEMDLVISVDTAVLHLAGALGARVWGLLPVACDWRWLSERTDSPWYPTMRLFRQDNWRLVKVVVKGGRQWKHCATARMSCENPVRCKSIVGRSRDFPAPRY